MFVHDMNQPVYCPICSDVMARVFTTSNMILTNRQKPRPFKHEPQECNADKDIWLSVIKDAERKKISKKEFNFWKKEVQKNDPTLIL